MDNKTKTDHTQKTPINFVVVELCDNDFGTELKNALRDLIDDCGGVDFCPFIAKAYIINHIASAQYRHDLVTGFVGSNNQTVDLEQYLKKLRVTFRDKLPTYTPNGNDTINADGGSVYYDVNLDKIFSL